MKVVLATLNAKYIHMSLALRYLKAYSGREFSIDLVEYTIKDPPLQVVADLYERNPDVLGLSCYIWNIEETITILRLLKKVRPDLPMILGGPEVSYDVKEWLTRLPEVDFIVMGEGEETFHHLLTVLRDGGEIGEVTGIAYRDGEGRIVIHSPRGKVNLKEIPSPYRFPEDIPHLSNRIVYMETSRGCPFTCQFCLSSVETGVRYFDLKKIKEDILYLIDHGARTIKFVDRTFNLKKDIAIDMFRFLAENHRGTVFQFEITADILHPDVIRFLQEKAPPEIFRFEIGVQSTNEWTNRLVKRRQNFEKLSRTVRMIKESGKITQHLDLIAGLPEEDYDSFRKTFNDVFTLEPEELQLGFLKMLRGTGMRAMAEDFGYIYMDQAPYEILGNRVLPFADVIRIKRVEDILEKYWNHHRMDHTIRYLVREVFPTPFDFFQDFGDYWADKGWSRIGHQLEDLFLRLSQFLQDKGVKDWTVVEGLMKIDYFLAHRHKPRKVWWQVSLSKGEQADWIKKLAEKGKTEQELHKHVMLETVPFDAEMFLSQGMIRNSPSLLVAYYRPEEGEGPLLFSIPLAGSC
ncbi:B12-binding domain-containing radical SAM protein [Thermicanus aegyptius]|uniref:B12-binding domain-containing radical SAM protein n=1 Tax=Thermicanus aegyptius TaxID=94009 RepID=UPI00049211EB|nr:B12-binding domain-containing radical SAM protein [Thermicanus aegyptius]